MISIIFYIVSIIIFAILIKWLIHNLSAIDTKTKAICIIGGILAVSVISKIIFSFSKGQVEYPNKGVEKEIQKMLLLLFIPMNGLIILPFTANIIDKIKLKEIEKDEFRRKIIILSIILIVVTVFEINYLKNCQISILKFYHS